MKTPTYTPGPWILDDGNIIRATIDEVEVCHVTYSPLGLQHGNSRKREMTHEEYEANARLIAAAPGLLERLKGVANAYHWECLKRNDSEHAHDFERCPNVSCVESRATISKAEGR